MCFDSDFSMDPNESNDGSQGAFTGGNIPPYQAAWNPYMYGYQAPPSWFPQGEQQVPPNVSMVRPGTSKVFFPDRLTQTAGHRFRFTGPVGPVTGGNRLNSNPNSNKFKSSRATGSDRFTGRFDRFTGRFYRSV